LKAIISIVVISALKLQMLIQLGLITDFIIHQEQIAQERCENKELEEMECNGKCQMTKMLAEAEPEQPQQSSLPDLLRFNLELHPATLNDADTARVNYFMIAKKTIACDNGKTHLGFAQDVFHPPTFA
jgi:hypothetical protein